MKPILWACFWVLTTFYATAFVAPQSQGFVTDAARMLSAENVKLITQLASALEKETGVEMAVVTVPDLYGEPIEDAAVALFESWGVGKKDQDNGLLVLLSRNDRKIRVEVGYGLEGILPDGKVGRLIDEYALPAFRKEQYGQGLTMLSLALADTLAKAYKVELPYEPRPAASQPDKRAEWIATIVFFVAFILLFGTRGGRRLLPLLLLGTLLGGSHRGHRNDFGGFGGGGFGGFGGGLSGGGGASRGW